MRVGIGYDVHPLAPARNLVLGGMVIPSDKGLSGYSDADVLVHAIIDALLGAAGLRDIGNQFPAEDPGYRDISSLTLLDEVSKLVKAKGFGIGNIDAVIVAEQPRLAPFVEGMCGNVARALGISSGQVMVKATTTDGLGFTSRGEGMAAYAIALVEEGEVDRAGTTT